MNDIDSTVVDVGRRARSYWFSDGLYSIAVSICVVLLGLLCLWWPTDQLGSHRTWGFWEKYVFLGLMVVPAYFLLAKKSPVIAWLKSRITYPRTGYAAPEVARLKQEEFRRYPEWVVIFPLCLFSLEPAPWIGLIALAACLGFLAGSTRGADYAWLFVPGMALSGVLVSALPIPRDHRFYCLYIAYGTLLFIKGTAQLFRYLRQHPAPQA